MTPDTPYRFVEIWVPKDRRGRYTDPVSGWPTLVAELMVPLRDALEDRMPAGTNMLIHWLQEGPFFQVTWTAPYHWDGTKDYPDHEVLRKVVKKQGFKIKRILRGGTLGGALNGERWNPFGDCGEHASERRSIMLVQLMDRVCALYASTLRPVYVGWSKKPRYWEVTPPADRKQNPHGNMMESLMHLIANTTGASLDVMRQAVYALRYDDVEAAIEIALAD